MATNYLICDEYIGETVYLVYYNDNQWNIEEKFVNDGLSTEPYGTILIDFIPSIGQPYWVGKNFSSVLKTMPIVGAAQTGKTRRLSEINLYVHESQEGQVNGQDISYPSEGEYTGKIKSLIGTNFTEEPQIEISTDGIYQLHMLALEFADKQYKG